MDARKVVFSESPAAVLCREKGSSVALRRHVSNIPSLRAAWNVAAPVVASTADVAIFKMPRLRACASFSSIRVAVLRWRSASFSRPHSSPVTRAMAVPAVVALLLLRFSCCKGDLCGSAANIAALVQQPFFVMLLRSPAGLLKRAPLRCCRSVVQAIICAADD